MLDKVFPAFLIISQTLIVYILLRGMHKYIKLNRRMTIVTKVVRNAMAHCTIDCDDIINELVNTTTTSIAAGPATTDSHDRTAINVWNVK